MWIWCRVRIRNTGGEGWQEWEVHLVVPVQEVAKSFHEAEGKEVVPGERDRIVDQVEGVEGGQEWEAHLEVPVHDVAKSFHEADG